LFFYRVLIFAGNDSLEMTFGPLPDKRGAWSSMNRADEYRRLAKACMTTARSIASKERRHALIQMAQVWLRLAEEQSRPVTQQQQQQQPQPQPEKEGDKD